MVEEVDHRVVALRTMVKEAREDEGAARWALDAVKESAETRSGPTQIRELNSEAVKVRTVVERAYSLLVEDTKAEF
ncbi:hypothetical protein GUJ93_ZPchr0002g23112 [Zizania palustris]|uniref:Uncharacterized protein n=1 Tax=Zizania palustris TaxID=103762 RepID=A0A8J5RU47_ZIZPA|nr:hypothetical protein GUJ93_ZPchr0002g23112 [Zizania palustris]